MGSARPVVKAPGASNCLIRSGEPITQKDWVSVSVLLSSTQPRSLRKRVDRTPTAKAPPGLGSTVAPVLHHLPLAEGLSARCAGPTGSRQFPRDEPGRRRGSEAPPTDASLATWIPYFTGTASTFHISAAYSAMVRSLENLPEQPTLIMAFRTQASAF